ncbi:MAG: hypothetical protein FJ271_24900 [Planctomycetes bacterium]|nr:hypothetical protein [Planctomycetota bacterium]
MIGPSQDELHPSDEELRQYLSLPSALPPGRAEQITEHLESCSRCNQVLRNENPTPGLVREWGEVGSGSSAGSKPVAQANFLPETQDYAGQPQTELALPGIPGYAILGVLGHGGMGVVYKAKHLALNRLVALKMIVTGAHAGPQLLARFRAEAQAVARLQHPNIVQVFEIGEHDGLPFFSLEFVEGGSLSRKLAGNPQNPRAAAELVRPLSQAMQVAHQAGIIHRDLKPGNVLLNADGVPKIADFGLAKQLDSPAGQTQSGAILGTPSYMAPEQAAGKTAAIGPAADVYALGAILYEMLTGRPPFKAETPWDTVVQVIEQDVVPPARLQPKVPRDLETICLKCLRKEPKKRYESAASLADDLGRFLRDEPIRARPVSWWEQARKWARRRPAAAALIAVTALALAAAAVAGEWYLHQLGEFTTQLQTAAEREKSKAAEANHRAIEAQQERLKAEKAGEEAKEALAMSQLQHYAAEISLAQQEWAAQRGPEAWFHLENTPREFRDWEYRYLRALFEKGQTVFRGHSRDVVAVVFSPGGDLLASASKDGTVRLWDVNNGQQRKVFEGHKEPVVALAFSPAGKVLASASHDGTVRLWDIGNGRENHVLNGHKDSVVAVAFSPDGRLLASASHDKTVRVWDAAAGRERHVLNGHSGLVLTMAFSPDGSRLASGSRDTTVRLWDIDKGQQLHVLNGHTGWVNRVGFSADGQALASASDDKTVLLWDTAKGHKLRIFDCHAERVSDLVFSRQQNRLASASDDNKVRVWSLDKKEEGPVVLTGHLAPAVAVAFSRDGKQLASASADGTIRVWNVTKEKEALILQGHARGVTAVAFSPDGERLASASRDHTVRLWNVDAARESLVLKGHTGAVSSVAFSPGDARLASAGSDGTIRLWDLEKGHESLVLKGHARKIIKVAFTPDGKRLASASYDSTLRLSDVENKQPPNIFTGHTRELTDMALSPDGKLLASASSHDGTVRLWKVDKPKESKILQAAAMSVAFSPDSRRLVIAGSALPDQGKPIALPEGTVRLLNVERPDEETVLGQHVLVASAASFSPDGKRLATASPADGVVRLWDLSRPGKSVALKGHDQVVQACAFSPNGRVLASASWDKTIRLWDVAKGEELHVLKGHAAEVLAIAFNPDGSRLVSASGDHTLRLWEPEKGVALLVLRGHTGSISALALNRDGTLLASASDDGTVRVWEAPKSRGGRSLADN